MAITVQEEAKLLLVAANDLIADKAKWTQGASARDRDGRAVYGSVHCACTFCATGAVKAKYLDSNHRYDTWRLALAMLENAALRLYGKGIVSTNDTLGHAEVMATFSAAIQDATNFVAATSNIPKE